MQYTAYIRSDGTPYMYEINKNQYRNSLNNSGITGDKFDSWKFKGITASSLGELDKAIINFLNTHQKDITDRTDIFGRKNYKASLSKNNKYNDWLDSTTRKIISKGKEITSATKKEIVLEDGEIIEVLPGALTAVNINQWKNDVNAAIKLRNKQLKTQAINESFEKSGMNKLYESFAESANKGELEYKRAYGNYVTTNTGELFGVLENGKVKALNGGQAYEVAMNYFNQSGIREDFYRKALGTNNVQGKDYYEINVNGRRQRVQVDLTKDITKFVDKGLMGIATGNAQEFRNGQWVTLEGAQNNAAMENLRKPLDKMVKTQGLTNTMVKLFREVMVAKLSDAARSRLKQLNTATEQKGLQKESNILLDQIARNGIHSKTILDNLGEELRKNRKQQEIELKENENFVKLAQEQGNRRDLDDIKIFRDENGYSYAIGKEQLNNLPKGNSDGKLDDVEKKSAQLVHVTKGLDKKEHNYTIIYEGSKYFMNINGKYTSLTEETTLSSYSGN